MAQPPLYNRLVDALERFGRTRDAYEENEVINQFMYGLTYTPPPPPRLPDQQFAASSQLNRDREARIAFRRLYGNFVMRSDRDEFIREFLSCIRENNLPNVEPPYNYPRNDDVNPEEKTPQTGGSKRRRKRKRRTYKKQRKYKRRSIRRH
jgi:hypothetical protein